ncbi:hypothetical protein DPMN_124247 [Dreissena polymorpha]|uniref:Uncharacterized protein n=1 Tax=Dreissena polymorpha TaxID=45954 RepID=A0A9D4JW00_DREPO|nr:hypothetical protein DPMN_124247 [Dreissena polymorpha]
MLSIFFQCCIFIQNYKFLCLLYDLPVWSCHHLDTFEDIEEKAEAFVAINEYKVANKRKKRWKLFCDESTTPSANTELSARDHFLIHTFYSIVDCLTVELRNRLSAYSGLHKLFGFMTEFESLNLDDYGNVQRIWSNFIQMTLRRLLLTISFSSKPSEADQDRNITHKSELLLIGGGQYRQLFKTLPSLNEYT